MLDSIYRWQQQTSREHKLCWVSTNDLEWTKLVYVKRDLNTRESTYRLNENKQQVDSWAQCNFLVGESPLESPLYLLLQWAINKKWKPKEEILLYDANTIQESCMFPLVAPLSLPWCFCQGGWVRMTKTINFEYAWALVWNTYYLCCQTTVTNQATSKEELDQVLKQFTDQMLSFVDR